MGGYGPIQNQSFLKNLDVTCMGEGEIVIEKLMKAIQFKLL